MHGRVTRRICSHITAAVPALVQWVLTGQSNLFRVLDEATRLEKLELPEQVVVLNEEALSVDRMPSHYPHNCPSRAAALRSASYPAAPTPTL